MAENYQQDRFVRGEWNGKPVSFWREFRGHTLTDDEAERLLAGETIILENLVSQRTGNEYSIEAHLEEVDDKVRVVQLGFVGSRSLPKMWAKHEFTDEEKAILKAGGSVHRSDWMSSKGSTFETDVQWQEDAGRIVPSFDSAYREQ